MPAQQRRLGLGAVQRIVIDQQDAPGTIGITGHGHKGFPVDDVSAPGSTTCVSQ
jgi:hypothetical protein